MMNIVERLFWLWCASCSSVAVAFLFESKGAVRTRTTGGGHRWRLVDAAAASSPTMLYNFWDDVRDFLDPDRPKQPKESFLPRFSSESWADDADDDTTADDSTPAGEVALVTLPVQSIKPGGLRLFLMLYLMGLQNTPDRQTWRADQPSTDAYVVDFWFHDQSAVLSVTLADDRVVIARTGSRPSTQYLMQESVVVQGLLDELQTMVSDQAIADENRLLVLQTSDSIERARDEIAFG